MFTVDYDVTLAHENACHAMLHIVTSRERPISKALYLGWSERSTEMVFIITAQKPCFSLRHHAQYVNTALEFLGLT